MEIFLIVHQSNILIPVAAGSVVLLLLMLVLFAYNECKCYRKAGLFFLLFRAVVILVGLIGVFIFGRDNFVLLIAILSGYLAYSGYRILQAKSNLPPCIDISAMVFILLSAVYYVYVYTCKNSKTTKKG